MPTLDDFFRTGTLGPVRGGMTEAEVVAALGPPDGVSVQKKPRILRYGPLQLTFVRGEDGTDRVTMIALYPRDVAKELPAAVRFDPDPLRSRARAVAFLSEIGVTPTTTETSPSELVRLPSGVQVVFDDDAVHGVYASTSLPGPPVKQLTLTLPAETMETLKVMAKARRKRSVAELAASLLGAEAEREQNSPAPTS